MDEDFGTSSFNTKDDLSPMFSDLPKTQAPLLDMDGFETLEAAINAAGGEDDPSKDPLMDDFVGNFSSGLSSTTRPLMTSSEEDISEPSQPLAEPEPHPNILDFVNIEKESSPLGYTSADTHVEKEKSPAQQQQQHYASGQEDEESLIAFSRPEKIVKEEEKEADIFEHLSSSGNIARDSVTPEIEDPKIISVGAGAKPAYKSPAQPTPKQQSEVAMEPEKDSTQNSCDCPFSPGAWFNPDKLHPVVAEYVYWRDPKKSAIALTAFLVLLFSFKFFSVISVAAYLTLALLSVTVSFRIYKNVLQAIQKSNDGHPFKEYLEKDITLSQDKVGETVETLIGHLNCISGKLRSLILVEDLVDTIKFLVLAWCLTYVGAWFNGLTLVILGVVSAFTFPKVYEANKAQIDVYAELVCTKGKEVIEMVNAKMPMGKKKKDQ